MPKLPKSILHKAGINALPDEMWTLKDGSKIKVSEMDENHVRNALRMLLRKMRQKRAQSKADNDYMEQLMHEAWIDTKNFGDQ